MKRNIIPNIANAIIALKGLKMYVLFGKCKTVLAFFKAIKNLFSRKRKKLYVEIFSLQMFQENFNCEIIVPLM